MYRSRNSTRVGEVHDGGVQLVRDDCVDGVGGIDEVRPAWVGSCRPDDAGVVVDGDTPSGEKFVEYGCVGSIRFELAN